MSETVKFAEVTLVRSPLRRPAKVAATAQGLGLRRLNQTRKVALTVENLGMINKIAYLLDVKELGA